MKAWDFLVDRSNLSQTALRAAPDPDPEALADGEVLLEVERFALTSNNITYGVVGDRLGYWRFFAAPDGWGRIPVWGFARVIASRAFGVDAGLRLYGYWPMSTHLVTRLAPSESGFMDVAAHRSALPATYNRYEVAPAMRGDDHNALLRPLFTTAFLLDNYLAEIAPAATPLVSSASSRTAIGLAWLLARRGVRPVALTSARNALFVEQLGLYSEVVTYGALEAIGVERSVVFVDMAGEAAVRSSVHRWFGDRLAHSLIVGSTHHDAASADGAILTGPQPSVFFAPDQLDKLQRSLGAGALSNLIGQHMGEFIATASWLNIMRHRGPEALGSVFRSLVTGDAAPGHGHVVLPA